MNIKNKFIVFFIIILIFTLGIVNIKNNQKTKFYLFTSKTEQISLGNLITLSFLSGLTLSAILTFISKHTLEESGEDHFINDQEIENIDENISSEELKYDRPPERDIRESQPTISVNYRFVDQDYDSFSSKNTKKEKSKFNIVDNDWVDNDDDW